MSSTNDAIADAMNRLVAVHLTAAEREGSERAIWPAKIWQALDEAGLLDALVGGLESLSEAKSVLKAAGRHAIPGPLADTLILRWLAASCGADLPAGRGALCFDGRGASASGESMHVAWAQGADWLLVAGEKGVAVIPAGDIAVTPGNNIASEPRDRVVIGKRANPMPYGAGAGFEKAFLLSTLATAAQMSGALEQALAIAVRYVNDRIQFGRQLAKFQAIQQQLALVAEDVASTAVAVDAAFDDFASGDPFPLVAAAKIRAGEAASQGSEIVHQVHGAIGFTRDYELNHLTRRLWAWRDEGGTESEWSMELGRRIARAGANDLWPMLTRT